MIRIHTLGSLSIRGEADGQPLTGSAAQPRRMAVLALLARAGSRGLAREKLQAMLWPDDERGPRTLTQALYALRQDLGAERAIAGTAELRLDPELVSSDVVDFAAAVSRGDETRAASLYQGPFLDGFHLPGLAEFERWVDSERRSLAQDYSRVLESLARAGQGRGDISDATNWWRKLAALDPLNARYAIGLMNTLVSAGDRAGALKHARVYEVLLEQELDLSPDREVVLLAERLRREASDPATSRANAALSISANSRAAVPAAAMPPAEVATTSATSAPVGATLSTPGRRATDVPVIAVSAPPVVANIAPAAGATATAAPVTVAPATGAPVPVTSTPVTVTPVSSPATTFAADATLLHGVMRSAAPRRSASRFALLVVGGAFLGAAIAAVVMRRAASSASTTERVVAIGRISEYETAGNAATLGAPLGDLLATNLARIPGLRVVSPLRMLELEHQGVATSDSSGGNVFAAARTAGATEIVDGTVFRRSGAQLRLDLRRIDLKTGSIIESRTVEGADVFALVDSGTARLALSLGTAAPPGSVASVTTHSDAAYQLYVQGLDRFYDLDRRAAERLFAASLAADSTFAMAAYYLSLSAESAEIANERIAHAVALSGTASERERLIIRADAAMRTSSPELAVLTDTLAMHFPDEVETQLYRGESLMLSEDFLAAVPHLQRVIAMDSLGRRATRETPAPASRRNDAPVASMVAVNNASCYACTAFSNLIYAYLATDSLAAAERETRRWIRMFPQSPSAYFALSRLFANEGRADESVAEFRNMTARIGNIAEVAPAGMAVNWLLQGNYARADALLRALAEGGNAIAQGEAHWYLAIAAREQGRMAEAVTESEKGCTVSLPHAPPGRPSTPCLSPLRGALLDEAGSHREAVDLFVALSKQRGADRVLPNRGRTVAWALTHAATALANAGDTARLTAMADTVRVYGAQSGFHRDQQLHHYVRGLQEIARRHDDLAIAELQQTISSRTLGYTRASYVLAQTYLRQKRARDAIALLQPALHFEFEGSTLYVSRTELHALLASAWEAVGAMDSASVHYDLVARTWAGGDPPYRVRAERARAWVAAHPLRAH